MNANEVLSMYEEIAGLTAKMAAAAQSGEFERLAALESQCAIEAAKVESGVPTLEGATRMRKIDLLKQIMANDRAIREVTTPWKLEDVMAAAH